MQLLFDRALHCVLAFLGLLVACKVPLRILGQHNGVISPAGMAIAQRFAFLAGSRTLHAFLLGGSLYFLWRVLLASNSTSSGGDNGRREDQGEEGVGEEERTHRLPNGSKVFQELLRREQEEEQEEEETTSSSALASSPGCRDVDVEVFFTEENEDKEEEEEGATPSAAAPTRRDQLLPPPPPPPSVPAEPDPFPVRVPRDLVNVADPLRAASGCFPAQLAELAERGDRERDALRRMIDLIGGGGGGGRQTEDDEEE